MQQIQQAAAQCATNINTVRGQLEELFANITTPTE